MNIIYRPTKDKSFLNLGCGKRILDNHLNVDCVKLPGVDVVVDLNIFPWPFESNSWQRIKAYHVFEHLVDFDKSIRELHRILAPGGVAELRVPHMAGWGAWNNPSHRHFFTRRSFKVFERGHGYNYFYGFSFSSVLCKNNFGKGFSRHLNLIMNPIINNVLYDYLLWKFIPCAEVEVYLTK